MPGVPGMWLHPAPAAADGKHLLENRSLIREYGIESGIGVGIVGLIRESGVEVGIGLSRLSLELVLE